MSKETEAVILQEAVMDKFEEYKFFAKIRTISPNAARPHANISHGKHGDLGVIASL